MPFNPRTGLNEVFSLKTGEWISEPAPVIADIGRAKLVRRRRSTFRTQFALFWDCSEYGAGFVQTGGPGAIVLDDSRGLVLDMQTGRIYTDSRFVNSRSEAQQQEH